MLTEQQWNEIVNGIVAAEYSLLTGAGFSVTATSSITREKLPDAKTLAKNICEDFQIDGITDDLRDAYEASQGRTSLRGWDRDLYLSKIFSNAIPDWHEAITDLNWKDIWTLNIDDVLENSYRANSESPAPVSINWNSHNVDKSLDSIRIIHLHGYAGRPDVQKMSDHNFVFDNIQYTAAFSSRYPWHSIFRSEFTKTPFIIIGTQFNYEFDLEEAISTGSASYDLSGRHSYLIARSIPPIKASKFQSRGLITIEADAKDFILELKKRVGAVSNLNRRTASVLLNSFTESFRPLRLDSAKHYTGTRDIFSGDEPSWSDAIEARIADSTVAQNATSRIETYFKSDSDEPLAIYIEGGSGTGKTCTLYRIAVNLISRGFSVFLFRKEDSPNTRSIVDFIKNNKNVVILIDGVADFIDEFSHIYDILIEEGLKCAMIYSERITRSRKIFFSSLYKGSIISYDINALKYNDVLKIIDNLERNKRLGFLTDKSIGSKIDHFLNKSNGDLMVALYEIEYGMGFRNRVFSEFDEIPPNFREIYILSCVLNSLDYQVPLDIANRVCGISLKEIVMACSQGGPLYGYTSIDHIGLKTRHRMVASQIISRLEKSDELIGILKKIFSAYCIHVRRDNISSKSIYVRSLKGLMNSEIIFDWCGDRGDEIYSHLATVQHWDARFWEQRALYYHKLQKYSQAVSYSKTALKILRDTFTYNTFGTIVLSQAIAFAHLGQIAKAIELYQIGLDALRSSRETDRRNNQHPYVTMFTKCISLAETSKDLHDEVFPDFHDWMRKAKYSNLISREEMMAFESNFGRISARYRRENP